MMVADSPETTFVSRLLALRAGAADNLDLRNKASAEVRDHLSLIRKSAEANLLASGHGTNCAIELSQQQDEIVRGLLALACAAHATSVEATGLAVIAVGGYGRGTLAPGSDIDLLFLVPDKITEATPKLVEFILYALWDARQKVGHATRTIDDCLSLARSDTTILTSMLEARFVAGNVKFFGDMIHRYRRSVVQKGAKSFVADKLAERDQRHTKYGLSRYAVEPDIKDGKGGLRDLHTLFWIASSCLMQIRQMSWRRRACSARMNCGAFRNVRIFFGRCVAICISSASAAKINCHSTCKAISPSGWAIRPIAG